MSQENFTEESSPYAPSKLVFKEGIPGVHLLLDPDTPNWAVVDKIGKDIISMCDGNTSVSEITKVLCQKYQESYEESIDYILKFVNELKEKNILKIDPFPDAQRVDKSQADLNETWINITNQCNLRCIHCHLGSGSALKNELTTEEIFHAIDTATELGTQKMVISGGEPFMRKDLLPIVEYSKKHIDNIVLLTNGTLITRDTAHKLKEWDIKVQVSLDGAQKETNDFIRGEGAYEKTISGIKTLIKEGVDARISMTLMKINMNEIQEMAALAKRLGIKMLHIPTPQIKGRAKENEEFILPSDEKCIEIIENLDGLSETVDVRIFLEEFWHTKIEKMQKIDLCGAGCTLMSIAADGEVYPCAGLHETEFSAGNIREKDLKDIWKDNKVFRRFRSFSVLDILECRECDMKFICGGGCHVDRYFMHGDLNKKSPLCKINYELAQYFLMEQAKDIQQ